MMSLSKSRFITSLLAACLTVSIAGCGATQAEKDDKLISDLEDELDRQEQEQEQETPANE